MSKIVPVARIAIFGSKVFRNYDDVCKLSATLSTALRDRQSQSPPFVRGIGDLFLSFANGLGPYVDFIGRAEMAIHYGTAAASKNAKFGALLRVSRMLHSPAARPSNTATRK